MNGEIRTYFELEARELVDRLSVGVARLDHAPLQPEQFAAFARAAHTLKGAAHVVGEKAIAALAHQFEDALEQHRRDPSQAGATRLLQLTDALAVALRNALGTQGGGASKAEAAALPDLLREADVSPTSADALDSLKQRIEPDVLHSTIRVDREETGALLNQIQIGGALVSALSAALGPLLRMESELSQSSEQAGDRSDWVRDLSGMREQMQLGVARLERQFVELQQTATRLGLVSTGNLLIEAGRMVRATAAAVRRDVTCVTRGGNDRVDSQIVEALQDALLHLVRNAVAHGIESVSERRSAGKARTATVTVSVLRHGSDIVLTCEDDGRGIALEPIRQAAVRRGWMSVAEAAALPAEALLALLLRPGFTTREQSDQLAGRGFGLDAVNAVAERLHGEVRISSNPGRGTTITLTAPRTLFAVRVLMVSEGGGRYALPVEAVEQTFALQAHHKVTGQGSRTVLLDGEAMSYLSLDDVVPTCVGRRSETNRTARSSGARSFRTCVVLRTGTGPLALAVDRVETIADVLVQPLPAVAGAAPTITGATLSADGRPFLVLNPEALLGTFATGIFPAPEDEALHGATDPILVIDDSLTTRMLEQTILQGEGYTVDLAVSAEQGLVMARQKRYSLFLVDVEMPGMSGYDFVRLARADAELQSIPSILVTSLDSAEAREQGRAAGAVSYVVKGEFNQQVYLKRIRAVMRGGG